MRYRRVATKLTAILIIALAAQFSTMVAHAAWWNKDWTARKAISLDTSTKGVEIREPLEEVPVLVRLHTGNFQGFFSLKEDASDLRFTAGDDKTLIPHHIEKFDPVNEIALVWVRVPKLEPGNKNNTVSMYFGNAGAPSGDNPAGSYDASQALVYHFETKGANDVRDKSSHGNHPASISATVNPAGFIGNGARFSGKQSISIAASPSLQIGAEKGWTFSAWIRLEGQQKDAYILQAHGADRGVILAIDGTVAYARYAQSGRNVDTSKTRPLSLGGWHHLALTVTKDRILVFVDGEEAASAQVTVTDFEPALSLGAEAGGGRHGLVGELDEVMIATTARSAEWLKLAAKSQVAGSNLVVLGKDDGESGGGGSSYFGSILSHVTVDGWIVIFLCVVMGVISWVVMVVKGMVVKRTRKDNAAFREAYQRLASGDAAALDRDDEAGKEDKAIQDSAMLTALFGKHDHYQSSTLYHLYHAGMHDIKSRLGSTVGAKARGLSPQAIASVRATVDAAMVRESQKLGDQMVLLTIAISGGPFLGLLGTVIGVMITFAAIAATGDVNINAIAPGIAAALVATVAGLMVAIPALFGYNYLTTQLRDLNADMRVFVDQFMTLVSERYEC